MKEKQSLLPIGGGTPDATGDVNFASTTLENLVIGKEPAELKIGLFMGETADHFAKYFKSNRFMKRRKNDGYFRRFFCNWV